MRLMGLPVHARPADGRGPSARVQVAYSRPLGAIMPLTLKRGTNLQNRQPFLMFKYKMNYVTPLQLIFSGYVWDVCF